MANVSNYKANQAIALTKAVDRGEVAASEIDAVIAGDKRLRDVVPRRKTPGNKRRRPPERVEHEDEVLMPEASPVACEAEVRHRWAEQKADFAITDHRELRRLFIQVIREEQRQFEQ